MIGAMTIITTFLSPYVIKLGWKATQSLVDKKKDDPPPRPDS
jgi:CPA2 family monovalent cation:H+ antiporter-2